MQEFTTEQAFEIILGKLQEAYQGVPEVTRRAVEAALSAQRSDYESSLALARAERQKARSERDDYEKKAVAGAKLWAAINKAHGEFIDDPTQCLMNIKKAIDDNAEHLDPDWIPF